ncbi:dimethylsulfonioproprionate lyase family protein [Mesorhizobium atlanticum]
MKSRASAGTCRLVRSNRARLPTSSYLDRIAELAPAGAKPLTRFVADHRDELRWGRPIPPTSSGRVSSTITAGWKCSGMRGHFVNDEVAAGLLILGPDILYPDHHHIAEEIYIPLTGGTEWRMGEGDFNVRDAGEVIHHASNVSHAMRTDKEPLMALYLWRGGPLAHEVHDRPDD